MSEQEMRAVQYRAYGGPEVLRVGAAQRPEPRRGEVLVEVSAFSVNAFDLLARRGKVRGLSGFGFPKGTGVDFAGLVREVAPDVSGISAGDAVWGYRGMVPPGRAAAGAEYLTVRADRISVAPATVLLAEAAALPLVGLTALQALRGPLRVSAGKRVLVVGGNGGVGSTAIQISRALGATVDAVVGAAGQVAIDAGARRTYDYRRVTPDQIAERYDAILATTAVRLNGYRRLVAPGGRIAAVSPAALPAILASLVTPGPVIRMVSGRPSSDDLVWLACRVDDGRLRPLLAGTYPLDRVADAHRDAETLTASGKRVVVVQRP